MQVSKEIAVPDISVLKTWVTLAQKNAHHKSEKVLNRIANIPIRMYLNSMYRE